MRGDVQEGKRLKIDSEGGEGKGYKPVKLATDIQRKTAVKYSGAGCDKRC